MAESPVLLIGLDALDLRYVEKFSESLPALARMQETGICTELNSTHPPWTPSAWPSMYTGVDPSHHGVYDFFDYHDAYPGEADVVTRQTVDAPAIWNYLSERGLRNVALNVPVTHPAEEVQGSLVPGYLAPADEAGYPPEIREEITEAIDREYSIYADSPTEEDAELVDEYIGLMDIRQQSAEYLLQRDEWDFAFLQLQKTDTIFHESDCEEDFRRIYERADSFVDAVLEASPDDVNVILASDHGMGPMTGQYVYVNEILSRHDLLVPSSEVTSTDFTTDKADDHTDTDSTGLLRKLIDTASLIGLSPGNVYHAAKMLGIDEFLLDKLPSDMNEVLAKGVDWEESKAYCRRESEHGVRINLEGRDPSGVVSPDDYESVRTQIIDILSNLETPAGDLVFEWVVPREEVYEGPYAEDACDVLFRPAEMNHRISTRLYGKEMTPIDTYHHKSTGVLMASGPDINSEWDGSTPSLLNVAPIVFSLLGEPIPNRLHGSVPDRFVTTNVERSTYEDVSFGKDAEYSQNQPEVRDRLKNLGYI